MRFTNEIRKNGQLTSSDFVKRAQDAVPNDVTRNNLFILRVEGCGCLAEGRERFTFWLLSIRSIAVFSVGLCLRFPAVHCGLNRSGML